MGAIREVDDGVANIEGLTDAMLNEMIDRGHGITRLALNLQETEDGVIIFRTIPNSRRGTRPIPLGIDGFAQTWEGNAAR